MNPESPIKPLLPSRMVPDAAAAPSVSKGHRWATALATLALALSVVEISAAALPVKAYLPLDLAQTAAGAAAQCRANGYSIAVVVLDRTGEPIAMLRSDDARPHHAGSARRKAYTALTFQMPSADLAPLIAKDAAAAALKDVDGVIALGGGLPIRQGNDIVGSIGVAGAPGSDKDFAFAEAGLAAIAPALK